MYGPAGRAYVYLVYGMYDCLNIVTEPEGRPAAILVRAVEPIEGIDAMRMARLATWRARRRSQAPAAATAEAARLDRLPPARLASGPGLVAAALEIDRSFTGLDLLDPDAPLHLEAAHDAEPPLTVAATPRLGIGYAGAPWTEVPWRFVAVGHPAVSGPRASRVP
jgi:DNA-3-methyladenine glycosylase